MPKEPYEIVVLGDVSSNEDCLRGLLQHMCSSFSEKINTILTIISEKYGHSREELSLLLQQDPRLSDSLKKDFDLTPPSTKETDSSTTSILKTKKGKKVIIKKPSE